MRSPAKLMAAGGKCQPLGGNAPRVYTARAKLPVRAPVAA